MAKKETTARAPVDKATDKKGTDKKGKAEQSAVKQGKAELSAVKQSTAKQAPAQPAKKSVAVVTITDLGDHLASTFDIPKSHAKIYLNETVALIGKHLKKGAKIRMSGLGVFQVKKRAARKGRNPNTGEAIKIKASKRVVFAASRDLKAKL